MTGNLPKLAETSSAHPLWLRLTAFISMKAPQSQRVYRGVVQEWCRFLGADAGTPQAAALMLGATDLQAMAYRAWLTSRPGQAPRHSRSRSSSNEIEIIRHGSSQRKTKLDGLQSTQTNSTIAKKLTILRRLYRTLIDAELGISQNPFSTDRVPSPSRNSGQKRPTEMIEFALVNAIVNGPDTSTPKGLRDKAILALLFGGGLRRGEVAALRLADVRKSTAGTPFVVLRATKGKKDSEQALPEWAATPVMELVQQRLASGAQSGDFLCVSYRGQAGNSESVEPISTHGIYILFKHYCALAGAGPHVSPHSARATAITRLLDSGIPYREVQEFSRHSSVQMVEAYDKRRIGVDKNPARKLSY